MSNYLIITSGLKKIVIEYVRSLANLVQGTIIETPGDTIPEYSILDRFIYFGAAYANYTLRNESNIFLVNLEQLTIDGTHSQYNFLTPLLNIHARCPRITVCDYSNANCIILKKHGILSRYLPYQVNRDEIHMYEKTLDYVLCCSFNSRTNHIYSSIVSSFDKHMFIGNPPKWGRERDNILFRSKILINVHHREHDYNILEEIRITRCILNKVIVISEYSEHYATYPLSNYIIFGKYDDLATIVTHTLNNYNEIYSNLYKEFDINSIDTLLNTYIEKALIMV